MMMIECLELFRGPAESVNHLFSRVRALVSRMQMDPERFLGDNKPTLTQVGQAKTEAVQILRL